MKYLIIFLLTFTIKISAVIVEVPHFKNLLNYIKPSSLILLDIDDTLLIPTQMLGCDEWFMDRTDELINKGMSKRQALEQTISEWEAIRNITNMQIVEEGTDLIVKRLQDEGFCVMCLTTQGFALATRTHTQLSACNFDMLRTAPTKEGYYFEIQGHGILYSNGMLFTSGRHKGKALQTLLNFINIKPDHVVFINDKESHLKEIEETMQVMGIEFVGLRYSYCDKKKQKFNPVIAKYQFANSSFNHILSDEEAEKAISQY
jgi:hypothetical protein